MDCEYKRVASYCDLVKEKINPLFCEKVCKGNWKVQRKQIEGIKAMMSTKQLTYEQVWLNISKALSHKNKKIVPVEEYIKRRKACLVCNGGTRCPHHCCSIVTKLILEEFTCKKGRF